MLLHLALACAPDAVAWRAAAPRVTAEVDVLTFDAVPVGDASVQALVLRNDGDAAGRVELATEGPFTVDRDAVEVGAGGTVTLTVQFRPVTWTDADGAVLVDGAPRVALVGPVLADADGDGEDTLEAGGADCDDGDATIHPGADDPCGDDVDADCDPSGDDDCDADGATTDVDCDDADPAAYPGATETGPDDRDEDCDGRVDEVLVAEGDLVLTELAPRQPSWLEICNVSARAVHATGFTVRTDAGSVTLGAGRLEPGACAAVCASEISDCAFRADVSVAPADTVELAVEELVVDTVAIDAAWGWDALGAWSLDPAALTAAANDDPAAWCRTEGTPGVSNPGC